MEWFYSGNTYLLNLDTENKRNETNVFSLDLKTITKRPWTAKTNQLIQEHTKTD